MTQVALRMAYLAFKVPVETSTPPRLMQQLQLLLDKYILVALKCQGKFMSAAYFFGCGFWISKKSALNQVKKADLCFLFFGFIFDVVFIHYGGNDYVVPFHGVDVGHKNVTRVYSVNS